MHRSSRAIKQSTPARLINTALLELAVILKPFNKSVQTDKHKQSSIIKYQNTTARRWKTRGNTEEWRRSGMGVGD